MRVSKRQIYSRKKERRAPVYHISKHLETHSRCKSFTGNDLKSEPGP